MERTKDSSNGIIEGNRKERVGEITTERIPNNNNGGSHTCNTIEGHRNSTSTDRDHCYESIQHNRFGMDNSTTPQSRKLQQPAPSTSMVTISEQKTVIPTHIFTNKKQRKPSGTHSSYTLNVTHRTRNDDLQPGHKSQHTPNSTTATTSTFYMEEQQLHKTHHKPEPESLNTTKPTLLQLQNQLLLTHKLNIL